MQGAWNQRGIFVARGASIDPQQPVSDDLPAPPKATIRSPGRGGHAAKVCSLRLSVRTPPFHGGESGSIPLGSAKHVATTFKARADHFQGLREPFSQPKFHPLHNPANGHQRAGMRDRKNGYGRYCNHNLRRALRRTPPNVAGLLSARYLTVLT